MTMQTNKQSINQNEVPTLDTATLDCETLKEQYKKANNELIKIMVRTKDIFQIYIVHLCSQTQNKAVNHCVNDAIQRLTQKTIIDGFIVSVEHIPYQKPGHPIFHAIIPKDHYTVIVYELSRNNNDEEKITSNLSDPISLVG